jgi:molybdopterin synthase catalytic subunit
MAKSICEVSITTDPLEFPGQLADSASGAVVDFWGAVREIEEGRALEGIEYEVHRAMAEHQMNLLAQKAMAAFFLTELVLRHRVGFVRTGEASLFLRVASRHRAAAFAASQWLIAELKNKVPIWKRPRFAQSDDVKLGKARVEEAASA